MSTITAARRYTPEDFLILPDSVGYELVDGTLVERNMGAESSAIASPATRTVRIHRPRNAASGSVSMLADADTISGEEVLPGFSAAVREFFDGV